MKIYLFRHGIAEEPVAGRSDSQRALTPEGRAQVASVARMAKRSGVSPSVIAASPYLRAQETAEVAAKELGWSGDILKLESLVPHGTPQDVWSDLRGDLK